MRDAELLAEAVDVGFSGRLPLEEAMAEYERQRNEAAKPEYAETCQTASFRPLPRHVFEGRAALRASLVNTAP